MMRARLTSKSKNKTLCEAWWPCIACEVNPKVDGHPTSATIFPQCIHVYSQGCEPGNFIVVLLWLPNNQTVSRLMCLSCGVVCVVASGPTECPAHSNIHQCHIGCHSLSSTFGVTVHALFFYSEAASCLRSEAAGYIRSE